MLISHQFRANRQGMEIAVRFDNDRAAAAGLDALVESPDLVRELGERDRIARSNSSRQIASRRGMSRCIAV